VAPGFIYTKCTVLVVLIQILPIIFPIMAGTKLSCAGEFCCFEFLYGNGLKI